MVVLSSLLSNFLHFQEEDFKILDNLYLYQDDINLAVKLGNKLALCALVPLTSVALMKNFNLLQVPRCLPHFIGRNAVHGSLFYLTFKNFTSDFYHKNIDELQTPIGRVLRSSCREFKTKNHIVQQFHVQNSRWQKFENNKRKVSLDEKITRSLCKALLFVPLAQKLFRYQNWHNARNCLTDSDLEVCSENERIESEQDLKRRIENLCLTDNEKEICKLILLSYLSLLVSGLLVVKTMSSIYKIPLKELQLICGVLAAPVAVQVGLTQWVYQDSPLGQIVRDHYFGERNADLMLARAEHRQKEKMNKCLNSNSMLYKFLSSHFHAGVYDVIKVLYNNNYLS